MSKFENTTYSEERALYAIKDSEVNNCTFIVGESPLKESRNVTVVNSTFIGKYPLWYINGLEIDYSTLDEGARAALWYCNDLKIKETLIKAPKNIRKCNNVYMADVDIPNAVETLWHCDNVDLVNVTAKGDYFAYGCSNIEATRLNLESKYSFDGVKNAKIINSTLKGRDAFWNCENIEVYDSVIEGEYIGWNTKNLKFVNCTISSLQGLCYVENLVLENCRLMDTTLAFEYSTVNATINGNVKSILNPISGTIKADSIDVLILEKEKDFTNLKVDCPDIKIFADSDPTKYF